MSRRQKFRHEKLRQSSVYKTDEVGDLLTEAGFVNGLGEISGRLPALRRSFAANLFENC